MVSKVVGYKGVQRKIKSPEAQIDNNIWKSKQPQLPRILPQVTCSGPLSRPRSHSKGLSTAVPNLKDKRGQDKKINGMQLLMFITQTQPSTLVWGKSWKYNKSLRSPTESAIDWGQCWMFATQQPCSETGKPWSNEPNVINPQNLNVWIKPDNRKMDSQQLNLSLPIEDWQMSWKKSDPCSKEDTNGENIPKSGFFTLLLETEHHDEVLHSSEWSESWRSTKSAIQQDPISVPGDGILNECVARKQDKNQEISSEWEECWRLVNHHCYNKSEVPQHKKSQSSEWANSWQVAMVVVNKSQNSNPTLKKDDDFNDHNQQKEPCFHKIMPMSHEHKDNHLYLQHCKEFNGVSEWSKSWQVTKNNSEPCEEIEKVLKTLPPRAETALEFQLLDNNSKVYFSTSEEADLQYEQLKHNIIYQPKSEFSQSRLFLLKYLEKNLPCSELRDSWRTIKHRMRLERRRLRINLPSSFKDSQKGGYMKPAAAEWNDSWKFTCQPLYQVLDLWQQGWSTPAQNRVARAKYQSHIVLVEFPSSEGTGEWSLKESWKFSRHQNRSEPGQEKVQIHQGNCTSHNPDNSWTQGRHVTAISDWETSWMVSETQLHHDKPSLTQWREAWKWSMYHTHWTESMRRENWVNESLEIEPLKGKTSMQRIKAKMSWSFDSQIFRERYHEKDWSPSWKAASLFSHQPSHFESSEISRQSISNTIQQQHASASEHGCKWGKSFRLANPMPQVEKSWWESPSNHCQYTVEWSREKKIQNDIRNMCDNNTPNYSLWRNSHEFLQSAKVHNKEKRKLKGTNDPRVIITKTAKTRRHLYSNNDKDKQLEKKWAGCHLLRKTQPCSRKVSSGKKLNPEDKTNEQIPEEWEESWRFLVRPDSLKKQMSFKLLSGWNDSWKFLVPPYKPLNGPKAK